MSIATPIIRPARVDEAEALSQLALRSKASWGYSATMVESFRAELTLTESEIERVLVCEVEGTRAGFYSLQPLADFRGELGHLFVEPRFQRRGLGRLMITDALQRAGARGFRVLVIQGDPNAASFYYRVGAKCVGERESDSIRGRMLPLFEMAVP